MFNNSKYKKFYSKESLKYHSLRYESYYGRIFNQFHGMVLSSLLPKNGFGLEVACGTGHSTELIALRVDKLIACDMTPAMMDQAISRVEKFRDKCSFLETDAFSLPFQDESFDVVIATRFLHLFDSEMQTSALTEMLRVLKKDGLIIVDFDNLTSIWVFCIPYMIYNLLRYRRLRPDSNYNAIKLTCRKLGQLNVGIKNVIGIGGPLILLAGLIPSKLEHILYKMIMNGPLRFCAEQFLICGRKR